MNAGIPVTWLSLFRHCCISRNAILTALEASHQWGLPFNPFPQTTNLQQTSNPGNSFSYCSVIYIIPYFELFSALNVLYVGKGLPLYFQGGSSTFKMLTAGNGFYYHFKCWSLKVSQLNKPAVFFSLFLNQYILLAGWFPSLLIKYGSDTSACPFTVLMMFQ